MSSDTTASSPPIVVPLLSTHVAQEKLRFQQCFYAFLSTMKHDHSPSRRLLSGQADVTRLIFEMASPLSKEDADDNDDEYYYFPCTMLCCEATHYNMPVEALYNQGGWFDRNNSNNNNDNAAVDDGATSNKEESRTWTGVYSDYYDERFFRWIPDVAWKIDPHKGNFLSEMQLRAHWREHQDGTCDGVAFRPVQLPLNPEENNNNNNNMPSLRMEVVRCNRACCVLPGDTLMGRYESPTNEDSRIVTGWSAATLEELHERGYMEEGEGYLYGLCKTFREFVVAEESDEEEMEEDDDEYGEECSCSECLAERYQNFYVDDDDSDSNDDEERID